MNCAFGTLVLFFLLTFSGKWNIIISTGAQMCISAQDTRVSEEEATLAVASYFLKKMTGVIKTPLLILQGIEVSVARSITLYHNSALVLIINLAVSFFGIDIFLKIRLFSSGRAGFFRCRKAFRDILPRPSGKGKWL